MTGAETKEGLLSYLAQSYLLLPRRLSLYFEYWMGSLILISIAIAIKCVWVGSVCVCLCEQVPVKHVCASAGWTVWFRVWNLLRCCNTSMSIETDQVIILKGAWSPHASGSGRNINKKVDAQTQSNNNNETAATLLKSDNINLSKLKFFLYHTIPKLTNIYIYIYYI